MNSITVAPCGLSGADKSAADMSICTATLAPGTARSGRPVNGRKTPVLPDVAAPGAEVTDRQLDPMKLGSIDDRSDAAPCRRKPRLGVSRRQEKGKVESG